jgi:hypothetical protein
VHLTPADCLPDPYLLIPFDLPPDASTLEIGYTYAHAKDKGKTGKDSGSVIDLGVFDARGCEFLTARGFRGWSGSARSEATLSVSKATPGYLSGPLYPGTWHIILGLYHIAAEGCDVGIRVSITSGRSCHAAQTHYVPPGTLAEGPAWFSGDLHSHTHHSDASGDVPTLVRAARAQGLDFCAITDHNTSSHLAALSACASPGLLLIPGIELTTYHGHANVWGIRSWIEFRAHTKDDIRRIRDMVRAQGLLFSINHPKRGGPPWEYGDVDADAIEGWQAPWFLSNVESLAFWDALLQRGKRPTLVGGSDKHQGAFEGTLSAYEVGTPTTWVHAENLSEQAILEGIRHGHVYLSRAPSGPHLSLTAHSAGQAAIVGDTLTLSAGDRVRFCCTGDSPVEGLLLRIVHRNGEWAQVSIQEKDWSHEWEVTATDNDYWRVEVIEPPDAPLEADPTALVAWALSNPIYLQVT